MAGFGALRTVLIAVDDHATALAVARRVLTSQPGISVAATARFDDQADELRALGAKPVSNLFADAGVGLALHTLEEEGEAG